MSNKEQVFELKFGIDMLPAMLHALSLARCTAMMCEHSRRGGVCASFDEQYRALASQIRGTGDPEEERVAVPDEYLWWKTCAAMRTAHRYHFHAYAWKPSAWSTVAPYDDGRVWPVIDGRSHELGHGHRGDTRLWPAFRDALELLAPIDAVREPDVAEENVPEDRRKRSIRS